MAKQKTYKSHQGKTKQQLQSCGTVSKKKQKKMRGAANRTVNIERGYDPAFVGGGIHGGTPQMQNKRDRKLASNDLRKMRSRNTKDLHDDNLGIFLFALCYSV